MGSNRSRCLLFTFLLGGCTAATDHPPSRSDLSILVENERFALVRLQPGQNMAGVAGAMLGDPSDAWQLREINPGAHDKPGEVLAVPLLPVNPSSVYSDGYRVLPILCYHQFSPGKPRHQLDLGAAEFEAQMQYLVENRYRTLSFAEVQRILKEGQPIPERAVVITIDDGYRSVYEVAWPILRKYNLKSTLFVYTDFIGGGASLSWAQMREMAQSGLVEVESHAKSHSSLSRLPEDKSKSAYKNRVREEVTGSATVFKRQLDYRPRYLSYPYGNSSPTASQVLMDEGYQLAATVTRGDNTVFADPFLLHRTMVYSSHDLGDFARMLRNYRKKPLK